MDERQMPADWPEIWAAKKVKAQSKTHLHHFGFLHARIPYGTEVPNAKLRCWDCDVERGQFHVPLCSVERCPVCGGQLLGCGDADDDLYDDTAEASV